MFLFFTISTEVRFLKDKVFKIFNWLIDCLIDVLNLILIFFNLSRTFITTATLTLLNNCEIEK
jgi:hypothetical protein